MAPGQSSNKLLDNFSIGPSFRESAHVHQIGSRKSEHDQPTIGLLLCKTQNRIVAEYALRDTNKPIGVAEYQLVESLPVELTKNLPSIEQIEQELGDLP
ncbi:DUF1016 family protein [Methylomonas sp. EFPC1]|uniref:PDDEXK nuclease domain-containing protein n=1 Tax=Methylomonas sp. EFPC1 TaxID=2812647 RepID=UPI0019688709|nr:PDDEXK nuclease domain-containing protein [Methylomonas sp. EFPC1]QSB01258.1 DUF1016 family protein [Methylomonas sp. EFPC1]